MTSVLTFRLAAPLREAASVRTRMTVLRMQLSLGFVPKPACDLGAVHYGIWITTLSVIRALLFKEQLFIGRT